MVYAYDIELRVTYRDGDQVKQEVVRREEYAYNVEDALKQSVFNQYAACTVRNLADPKVDVLEIGPPQMEIDLLRKQMADRFAKMLVSAQTTTS